MTTTIEPPQAPPTPPQPGASGPGRTPRSSSRVVAILVASLGVLIVLGALVSAVFSTVAAGAVHTSTRTVPVTGVTELDADVSASSLEIVFADVDEAELVVRGSAGADRWTLDTDGDVLTLASPNGWFGGWLAGWGAFGGRGDAVLTLPRALEGMSADLVLSAGEFTADGRFDELDLELNAGRAEVQGRAADVTVEVNAGRADVNLADVREASLSVSAGELNTVFTGAQPRDIGIDVSAGALHATVPTGDYAVAADVSAGGFDNEVRSVPGARSTISVDLSAGQVTLRDR